MSLANYLLLDNKSNKREFNLGNVQVDLSEIEADTVIIQNSLKAPEIDELNKKIDNLQQQINDLTTSIYILSDQLNPFLQSFNITNTDITIDKNVTIKGNFINGE